MKTLIIDNEKNVREALIALLNHFCPELNLIEQATGVEDGLKTIASYKPDIVFLDVEMDDGTGFDLVKQLHEANFQLIFVTAHDKYAAQAFRHSAIDFLVKPIDPALLIESVERAKNAQHLKQTNQQIQTLLSHINPQNTDQKIVLKDNANIYFVKTKDIIRCESDGAYTSFHLTDGEKIVISKTIKEYDELLTPKGFLRVHQSHLVQVAKIKRFERAKEMLVLENNEMVPVAQRKRDAVMEWLNK